MSDQALHISDEAIVNNLAMTLVGDLQPLLDEIKELENENYIHIACVEQMVKERDQLKAELALAKRKKHMSKSTKFWPCKHIRWFDTEHQYGWYILILFTLHAIVESWNTCPICGAKRPTSNHRKTLTEKFLTAQNKFEKDSRAARLKDRRKVKLCPPTNN